MRRSAMVKPVGITVLALLAFFVPAFATEYDSEETLLEQAKATEAEQYPDYRGDVTVKAYGPEQTGYPLFVGTDDLAESGFLVDPGTNTFIKTPIP